MRKFKLMLALVLPFLASAQLVVEAPVLEAQTTAQNVTMTQQLSEALAQSATLVKTFNTVKEGVNIYKEVSSAVRTLKSIKGVIDKEFELIKLASETGRNISKLDLSNETFDKALDIVSDIIEANNQNMESVEALLTNGKINADDGERILILQNIEERTDKNIAALKTLYSRCKSSHDRRSMYKKVRGTN